MRSVPRQPDTDSVGACTPRVAALRRAIEELNEAEMRQLLAALGQKPRALDRVRAAALRSHIGARCNVIWPGEAELFDATLVGIDEESGLVLISMSRDGPVWSVPPYTVRLA